jgi:glycosyltransferase involved in cell wall biosynthesis
MKGQRAIYLATKLEEACYRHSRKTVIVTQGVQERLLERGIPAEKLALIPNGANTDFFQFSQEERQKWRDELGLNEKFVALYAGLHGIAQGLDTIIETARRLQDDPSIHFLLVGEGPCKSELVALARHHQLNNITFMSEHPREHIPGLQSAADAAIIPLKKVSLFTDVVPSKLFDAWACQRPVILSVDGEARRLLEDAQGGIFTPPENSQEIANAIIWLKNHPQEREKMGANGRTYTVQNHSHPELARKLAEVLNQVVSRA